MGLETGQQILWKRQLSSFVPALGGVVFRRAMLLVGGGRQE